MTHTSHGHWIPGTPHTPWAGLVARCGGPGACTVCSREAAGTLRPTKLCPDHRPVQHRDGRPPWCKICGLTADMALPFSLLSQEEEEVMDPSITVPRKHDDETPHAKARRLVVDHFNNEVHRSDDFRLHFDQTYIVSFTYVLGCWKAMVSTDIPDQMYYEVTYDRDKKQAYVDAYVKLRNSVHPDADLEGTE